MQEEQEFGPPYNWCDSRCDRCPIDEACRLRTRLAGRRWVHEMRHEDPDDPAVVMSDVRESLQDALKQIVAAAEAEGIPLQTLEEPDPEPRVVQLDLLRLKQAGMEYGAAIHEALAAAMEELTPAQLDSGGVALVAANLIAVKIGRISAHAESEEELVWYIDTVPNLLLIEHAAGEAREVLSKMDSALPQEARQRIEDAARMLGRLLAARLQAIPAQARAQLEELVATGQAPSGLMWNST